MDRINKKGKIKGYCYIIENTLYFTVQKINIDKNIFIKNTGY